MAHLLIRHGSGHEEVHELSGLRFRIGRGPENDLSLADRTVSRCHAELVPADDGWLVRDLDSHNHVLVNGEPVHDVPLADGDVI